MAGLLAALKLANLADNDVEAPGNDREGKAPGSDDEGGLGGHDIFVCTFCQLPRRNLPHEEESSLMALLNQCQDKHCHFVCPFCNPFFALDPNSFC